VSAQVVACAESVLGPSTVVDTKSGSVVEVNHSDQVSGPALGAQVHRASMWTAGSVGGGGDSSVHVRE
jgi:hypothetical protein